MQVEVASKDSLKGAIIKISTPESIASGEAQGQAEMLEAAAATDRANLYSSLGALLAAPAGEEHLDILRNLPEIEQPESAVEMAWALLRRAASDYSLEQIDDEYHQLFIGLGRGVVVPYGSWHLTGFLMEKPLGALRADLRKLGFERSEGVSESEDHIASLCQAMAAIIIAEEIDFDTERTFFNKHISSWSDDFFRLLDEASCAGFYRAVGNLGKSFIEVEKQYLSMAV